MSVIESVYLGRDRMTGTDEILHYDHATDDVIIEQVQDVDAVVERALQHRRRFDERTPWKGDMQLVASVPMVIYMDLMKRGIAQDDKAMNRWLNDPDNAVFRTRPGKV